MRYLIIERFKEGCARAVYQRARERGRMLPEGLVYVDSWVAADLRRCFQLMECEDAGLLDAWFREWTDLVDFEVVPVIGSEEAASRLIGENGDSAR